MKIIAVLMMVGLLAPIPCLASGPCGEKPVHPILAPDPTFSERLAAYNACEAARASVDSSYTEVARDVMRFDDTCVLATGLSREECGRIESGFDAPPPGSQDELTFTAP